MSYFNQTLSEAFNSIGRRPKAIFDRITESLIFVIERWNKNQNVLQDIYFQWDPNRFELRLMVFMLQADILGAILAQFHRFRTITQVPFQ